MAPRLSISFALLREAKRRFSAQSSPPGAVAVAAASVGAETDLPLRV